MYDWQITTVLVSVIFWLHFLTEGGNRDASSIFTYVNAPILKTHRLTTWKHIWKTGCDVINLHISARSIVQTFDFFLFYALAIYSCNRTIFTDGSSTIMKSNVPGSWRPGWTGQTLLRSLQQTHGPPSLHHWLWSYTQSWKTDNTLSTAESSMHPSNF